MSSRPSATPAPCRSSATAVDWPGVLELVQESVPERRVRVGGDRAPRLRHGIQRSDRNGAELGRRCHHSTDAATPLGHARREHLRATRDLEVIERRLRCDELVGLVDEPADRDAKRSRHD